MVLIGINGKIKHGKDYAAGVLCKLGEEEFNIKFETNSWARCLRLLLDVLTGIAPEDTVTQEQKEQIFDINNLKIPDDPVQSVSNFLIEHGYTEQRDLKPPITLLYQFLRQKDVTYGRILQYFGTEVMRNNLDSDIWTKLLINDWIKRGRPNCIITDCRFPNEADLVKEHGGLMIRIFRPDNPSHNRDPNHPSEVSLDNYPMITITNHMDNSIVTLLRNVLVTELHLQPLGKP